MDTDQVQFSIESSDEGTHSMSSKEESQSISENEDRDFRSSNEESSNSESGEGSEIASVISTDRSSENKDRFQLLGECYIGFAPILKNILEFINIKDSNVFNGMAGTISVFTGTKSRTEIDFKDLQENSWDIKNHKLWYYGRKIGEIDIKIEAKNLPFIRQMTIGVLTGGGVRFASTPWPDDDISKGLGSRKDLPQSMKDLFDYLADFKRRD